MASIFGAVGNPFATKVGRLIEQATDASLASENWALNIEICDVINETEEGPKDAIRAIKKRLNANAGKNYSVVMYTLTVLEACVKNCHKRFHVHVAHKDFLGEMIKIISAKNDPPTVVQEKVLSLIQTWADAFRGTPDLKEVDKVYQDLKKKGIEFPMTDLDSMAPIHTPARTHEPDPQPVVARSPQRAPTTRSTKYMVLDEDEEMPPPQQQSQGPVTLTAEQQAKLKIELDTVQQNLKVFSEMLTEMTPGQEEPSDLELLQELNRTCRSMQQRIVELLDSVSNEEVTNELLRINDDMNNVFLRYERFERYRTGQTGPQAPTTQHMPSAQETMAVGGAGGARGAAGAVATDNLIDLNESSPHSAAAPTTLAPAPDLQQRLAGMSVAEGENSDEFDMFAQSRQSFETSKPQASSAYQAQQSDDFQGGLAAAVQAKSAEKDDDPPPDRPTDYDEMESWLKTNDPAYKSTATSSEFDQFLAERAKEADTLPDINDGQARGGRQIQKDDQDNTLFAL